VAIEICGHHCSITQVPVLSREVQASWSATTAARAALVAQSSHGMWEDHGGVNEL